MAGRERWNHNLHYHRLILDQVPAGATSGLDIGTGNGLLACRLRERLVDVVGIDLDEAVLDTARAERDDVDWVHGDVLRHEFGRRFDVVGSVATIHHLPDLTVALRRFADLVAPGGVLVVVGLARTTRPQEALLHLVGAVQHRWYRLTRGYWEHTAPTVWPPPLSYTQVRTIAEATLPGMRWRSLPMWRYALIWHAPS